MNFQFFIALWFLLDCCLVIYASSTLPFAVIGYVPEYRMGNIKWNIAARRTTDLILFSIQPNPSGDGSLDTKFLDPYHIKKAVESAKKKNTRVLVCVGGAGRSQGFLKLVQSSKTQTHFINNLISFCTKFNLDGIDYDWEAPVNKNQQHAYGILIQQTKQSFQPLNKLVTVTSHGRENLGSLTYNAVDRVHVMAYDMGDKLGRHSTFDGTKLLLAKINRALSIPLHKIIIGFPAYGRQMSNPGNVLTYEEIIKRYHPSRKLNEINDFFFNGIGTVIKKTKWAFKSGFGGVMMWEMGQDATERKVSLMASVMRIVRKNEWMVKIIPLKKTDTPTNEEHDKQKIREKKKSLRRKRRKKEEL